MIKPMLTEKMTKPIAPISAFVTSFIFCMVNLPLSHRSKKQRALTMAWLSARLCHSFIAAARGSDLLGLGLEHGRDMPHDLPIMVIERLGKLVPGFNGDMAKPPKTSQTSRTCKAALTQCV